MSTNSRIEADGIDPAASLTTLLLACLIPPVILLQSPVDSLHQVTCARGRNIERPRFFLDNGVIRFEMGDPMDVYFCVLLQIQVVTDYFYPQQHFTN